MVGVPAVVPPGAAAMLPDGAPARAAAPAAAPARAAAPPPAGAVWPREDLPRRPRRPRPGPPPADPAARTRRRLRHAGAIAIVLAVLGVIGSAAYLALQSVYFIGTNSRGLITLYEGLPYRLPGNLALYSSQYVSGVSASTLSPEKRRTLLDHSLRSETDAGSLIHSLELEQLE